MESRRVWAPRLRVPKGAFRELGAQDLGPRVLGGCCMEAERADRVGHCLQWLRNTLSEHLHPHLTAVIDQLQNTSQLLRDLADKSQLYLSQVPVTIDYLNVILPCLCRTLRDIMEYYEDQRLDKEHRWRTMYHNMSNELPGTTLPARFVMYNQFLNLLNMMLTRDPNFDINAMEALRSRILQLREVRKIDPPSPIRTDLVRIDTALDFWYQQTDSHWAEAIFTQPPSTRREFKKRGRSDAFGPQHRMGRMNPFPEDVKILVKRDLWIHGARHEADARMVRTFENDRISVIIFVRQSDLMPFLLIRTRIDSIEPLVSIYPIDLLMIEREASSVLHLSYIDNVDMCRKPWASLSFITWEELVLFYCTFICLKACDQWPNIMDRREFIIRKERRLFQAQIQEDDFDHYLVVVEDSNTKARRLHVVVRDGLLRRCPVWLAFVPAELPEDWLIQRSPRRIWLRDLQVYSFSTEYRPHRQRKGKFGSFEIKFAHAKAATFFKQLFISGPEPTLDRVSEVPNEELDTNED
ncbi:hypothetical protein GGS21DRAFT_545562 [Xylaria nigripes]|nr:hypothetical protein GGS21DRAFT_545562 [Xylaria nigripes]